MSSFKINFTPSRPRFSVEIPYSKQEMNHRFQKLLEEKNKTHQGIVNQHRTIIRLRRDRDKYWHPQLILRVEEEEEKVYLKGLFGPHAHVWTFFVFLYALGISIVLFVGLYGIVEFLRGKSSFFVWFNLLGIVIIAGTYIASKVGQQYSKVHIKSMVYFVKKSLEKSSTMVEKD